MTIPGFASAQRAYENKNPYDDECTCEDEGYYTCDDCGHNDDAEGVCPNDECPAFDLRPMTSEEIAEHFPSQACPVHGWCGGCSSRHCEDCNG
jgi:hypothetical protein